MRIPAIGGFLSGALLTGAVIFVARPWLSHPSIDSCRSNTDATPQQTIKICSEIIAYGRPPGDVIAAQVKIADTLAATGDYKAAVEHYGKALMSVGDADIYYKRANALVTLGSNQLAIDDFSSAIQINGRMAKAIFARGRLYQTLPNFNSAIDDYNLALRQGVTGQDFVALARAHSDLAQELTRASVELNLNKPSNFLIRR